MSRELPDELRHVLERFRGHQLEPVDVGGGLWTAPCPAHRASNVQFEVDGDGRIWLDDCGRGCLPHDIVDVLRIQAERAGLHAWVPGAQRAGVLAKIEKQRLRVASGATGRLGATPREIYSKLIARLRAEHPHPKRAAPRFECPACGGSKHGGLKADLSGGQILIHDFEGCSPDEVLTALGLTWADLNPPPPDVSFEMSEPVAAVLEPVTGQPESVPTATAPQASADTAEPPVSAPESPAELVPAPPPVSRRVDLDPWLSGAWAPPEPERGEPRDDAVRLLYPGRWHTCIGLTGTGKTWLALVHTRAELEAGRTVVYLHFEEDLPGGTVSRLLAIGVKPDVIRENFVWLSCERPWTRDEYAAELFAIRDAAGFEGIGLVVMDGINDACTRIGNDPSDPKTVGWYRSLFVAPATRAGAAVLSLGHPPKAPDRQAERHGYGATGWLDTVDGVAFRLVASKDTPVRKGAGGTAALYSVKDRYGSVERHGAPEPTREGWVYLGSLVVDDSGVHHDHTSVWISSPKGSPTGERTAPEAAKREQDEAHVRDTVATLLRDGHTPTMRAIRAASKLRHADTADALERLVIAGELAESTGSRRARVFTLQSECVSGSHTKGVGTGNHSHDRFPEPVGTSGNQSGESGGGSPGGDAGAEEEEEEGPTADLPGEEAA